MEIGLLHMMWATAALLTILSAIYRDQLAFPIAAGVCWVVVGMSMGEVCWTGWTSTTASYYCKQAGDPQTAGQVGSMWLLQGIGYIMILLSAGSLFMGRRFGGEV